jgi:hypothetical protein
MHGRPGTLCLDHRGNPRPIADLNVPPEVLRIGAVSVTDGGEFRLSWDVQSGTWYTVWWTDDLLTGWPSGQVFTTSNGDWTDPASSNVIQRFYRLTSSPSP